MKKFYYILTYAWRPRGQADWNYDYYLTDDFVGFIIKGFEWPEEMKVIMKEVITKSDYDKLIEIGGI